MRNTQNEIYEKASKLLEEALLAKENKKNGILKENTRTSEEKAVALRRVYDLAQSILRIMGK